jgi:hypothetical protein
MILPIASRCRSATPAAQLRLHEAHQAVDQGARREVLLSAGLLLGAGGFVIAFALQDSLSNFAIGMMILFFKPFDVGDFVDAGGLPGTVASMNVASTTIKAFDCPFRFARKLKMLSGFRGPLPLKHAKTQKPLDSANAVSVVSACRPTKTISY